MEIFEGYSTLFFKYEGWSVNGEYYEPEYPFGLISEETVSFSAPE